MVLSWSRYLQSILRGSRRPTERSFAPGRLIWPLLRPLATLHPLFSTSYPHHLTPVLILLWFPMSSPGLSTTDWAVRGVRTTDIPSSTTYLHYILFVRPVFWCVLHVCRRLSQRCMSCILLIFPPNHLSPFITVTYRFWRNPLKCMTSRIKTWTNMVMK